MIGQAMFFELKILPIFFRIREINKIQGADYQVLTLSTRLIYSFYLLPTATFES